MCNGGCVVINKSTYIWIAESYQMKPITTVLLFDICKYVRAYHIREYR